MQSRRELLFSAAAAAAVAAAVSPKDVFAATAAASDPATLAKATALYDGIVARQLRRSPETATSLGLDSGDFAWTKSMLSDASLAAQKENADYTALELKNLRTIDRSKLTGLDGASYDTVEFVLATGDKFLKVDDSVIAGKKAFMDSLDGGFWQFGDNSVPEVGVITASPLALLA